MTKVIFAIIFSLYFTQSLLAQENYTIGVVCPLTNSSNTFGIGHLQGATLAIKEFNRLNLDYEIDMDIVDDHSSPTIALNAISDFQNSNAIAVMGPCNSAVAKHVVEDESLKIPIISSLTTNSQLIKNLKNRYFFRANVPDNQRMNAMLENMLAGSVDSPDKLTIFYEKDDAYGEGLKQDVVNWLEANEKNFLQRYVSQIGYNRDAKSSEIRLLLDDAQSDGYLNNNHAVLLLGIASDARNIIKEIKLRNLGVQLYFSEPNHTVFQSLASEGVNVGGLRVLSVWDPDNNFLGTFQGAFRDEFADDPVFAASLSYEATKILLTALKKSIENGKRSTEELRVSIRDNLLASDLHSGLNIGAVLSGNLSLTSHEYKNLRFSGVQYFSDGSTGGWNDEDAGVVVDVTTQSLRLELPNLAHVLALILFGCIGGALREFQHMNGKGIDQLLGSFLRAEVIIDGFIAIVAASFLLIVVLVTQPSFLTSGANVSTVYFFSSVAVGVLSGFLGIRTIYALLQRFDIDISQDNSKSDQPS